MKKPGVGFIACFLLVLAAWICDPCPSSGESTQSEHADPDSVQETDSGSERSRTEEDRQNEADGTLGIGEDGFWYLVIRKGQKTPRVAYFDRTLENGRVLKGYYSFDSTGKLELNPGIRRATGIACGRLFDGLYPFLGTDGRAQIPAPILSSSDEEPAKNTISESMSELAVRMTEAAESFEGSWSIYLRTMEEEGSLFLNDRQFHPASLIKLFVMEATFAHWEEVIRHLAAKMQLAPTDDAVSASLWVLLENMVVYSDNESFNELVRLQDPAGSFSYGCKVINAYLGEQDYQKTIVAHTLHPSATKEQGIGEYNYSSARDCGILLERIFRGNCVNEEYSASMLSLLLAQNNTTKIRTGLPYGITCANKTGETSTEQHDAGIIYGRDATYVLSIMSESCPENIALDHIRELAAISYECLNR